MGSLSFFSHFLSWSRFQAGAGAWFDAMSVGRAGVHPLSHCSDLPLPLNPWAQPSSPKGRRKAHPFLM